MRGLHGVGRVAPQPPALRGRAQGARLCRGSLGKAGKRPVGAAGRDEARQAGCQPPAGYLCSHTHPARGQMGAAALWAADCPADGTGTGGHGLTDAVTRSGWHGGHSTAQRCLPPQHRHPSWWFLCLAFFGTKLCPAHRPGHPLVSTHSSVEQPAGCGYPLWGRDTAAFALPAHPLGTAWRAPRDPNQHPGGPHCPGTPTPGPPCSYSRAGTPPTSPCSPGTGNPGRDRDWGMDRDRDWGHGHG